MVEEMAFQQFVVGGPDGIVAFFQMDVQLPSSGGVFSSAALSLTQLSNRWGEQFCTEKNTTLSKLAFLFYTILRAQNSADSSLILRYGCVLFYLFGKCH